MRPVSIVVLAKYKEVFEPFVRSLYAQKMLGAESANPVPVYVVRDGNNLDPLSLVTSKTSEWNIIQGPKKFAMAGNGNLGLKAVPADHDILYCGDDIRFLEHDTIKRLQEEAYSHPDIGILSPKIIGRGSPAQTQCTESLYNVIPLQMWFPCVYIKRELIEKIGYLDEQFSDFGCDDFDYCIRTIQAGFKLAICSTVSVQHEASPEGGPTTFVKNIGVEKWHEQEGKAQQKVMEKYKLTSSEFQKLLAGDISVTQQKATTKLLDDEMLCTQQTAREFLKSQHLFIATPCYGGWASINYMQSLLALINICHDSGIKYTISFMHNESLITRARNKLADEFMKSGATQLFWIDADIGFDARDIISLMMYKGDIIGLPCARKNLRIDRVVQAVKKNGKEYSIDELENLMGEFVVNFPQDNAPKSINLGQLIEVMEVGTGLMRVRRETFEKIMEVYPDRWFLQMMGETGDRHPMYMFYQAGIDEESKSYNPGNYGDYVSEDYFFCRSARKAGLKVYLAPWGVTSHMGSYFFRANMTAVALSGGSLR